jgi:hypothetical protein
MKTWRRWLRFSVRGLVLFVLLAGGGIGLVLHAIRSAEAQRFAVAAIQKEGGSALYDWQFKDRRTLGNAKPRAPKWLVDLFGVDYFGHVTFVSLPVSAEERVIVQVGQFSRLELLLQLPTTLTDSGFEHLIGLSSLQHLPLQNTKVTDAALVNLTGMKCLQSLSLRNTQVTDAGLVNLAGIKCLQSLSLRNTQFTDAGLINLVDIPTLRYLDLRETQVTDAGLASLAKMINLLEVDLDDTNVTRSGAEGLRRLAPRMLVIR